MEIKSLMIVNLVTVTENTSIQNAIHKRQQFPEKPMLINR